MTIALCDRDVLPLHVGVTSPVFLPSLCPVCWLASVYLQWADGLTQVHCQLAVTPFLIHDRSWLPVFVHDLVWKILHDI